MHHLVRLHLALLLIATMVPTAHGRWNSENRSTRLKVSTLNMKWYGLGGFMWNTPDMEFRLENMRQFINQELSDSDVIVFTEVVKTETVLETIRPRLDCVTYQGAWSRHQHVMICFDPTQFRAEKYDENYIIENVDLGSGGLRPAAQAKICHKNGRCFLQVIGVHLAAGRKSEKRLEQVKLINEELAKQDAMLPTVVAGDFNSYSTFQSGLEEDDIVMFEKALSEGVKKFTAVTKEIMTYNSGDRARAYDHIITTTDIRTLATWGYEACKKEPDLKKTFIPFGSFRKYYTDHCPATATIEVSH